MTNKPTNMSTIIILLVIGLVAGTASGFIGIGGGVIIVPAIVYFIGMSQHQAQGISLTMYLLPIGLLGVINYYKGGFITMDTVKIALITATTFVIGSYIGSKFAVALSAETVKKIFGVFLLLIAFKMIFGK